MKYDSDSTLTLHAAKPLREATLLFLRPQPERGAVKINHQLAASDQRSLYGFEWDAVTMDLAEDVTVQIP